MDFALVLAYSDQKWERFLVKSRQSELVAYDAIILKIHLSGSIIKTLERLAFKNIRVIKYTFRDFLQSRNALKLLMLF